MISFGLSRLFISSVLLASLLLNSQPVLSEGIDEVFQKKIGDPTWGGNFSDIIGSDRDEKGYALVVGISDYDDSNLEDLPTRSDAIKIKNYLLSEAGYDYVHLLTEEKVTLARLQELMVDSFPSMLDDNDRFLFYWSGHGLTREVRSGHRGYLPVSDSKSLLYSSMLSMDDIIEMDLLVDARQSLYILDSCFSGLAGFSVKSEATRKVALLSEESSHLITAGRASQSTIASDLYGGSLFTFALLEGMRGRADSSNHFPKDGIITLSELKGYVESRVDSLRREIRWKEEITPQLRHLRPSKGEFYFVNSPHTEIPVKGNSRAVEKPRGGGFLDWLKISKKSTDAVKPDDAFFYLQSGAFAKASDAESLRSSLEEKGFKPFVNKVQIEGKQWHRVRTGPYYDSESLYADQNALGRMEISYLVVKVQKN